VKRGRGGKIERRRPDAKKSQTGSGNWTQKYGAKIREEGRKRGGENRKMNGRRRGVTRKGSGPRPQKQESDQGEKEDTKLGQTFGESERRKETRREERKEAVSGQRE